MKTENQFRLFVKNKQYMLPGVSCISGSNSTVLRCLHAIQKCCVKKSLHCNSHVPENEAGKMAHNQLVVVLSILIVLDFPLNLYIVHAVLKMYLI